ncbi:MAG: hypothetical protein JWN92_2601 [Candidatus Acidoferrum typicum]|nr:hypothetical protein [Candidatus Acidoferrum typicum]
MLWQNLRLAILWDLSYILETSYRISLGDVPYRDFPLPFAPLTFLTQAALIKLTGRVIFHHVIYAALAGGVATLLTWRIIFHLLNEKVHSARRIAFLLSVPLVFLGIYSVFPHPFYDCDCTLTILLAIFLLLQLQRKNFPPLRAFLTGAVLVVPMFVKQNVGLAFLAATVVSLAFLMTFDRQDRRRALGYAWTIAGAASGFALALALIHFTAGLTNYWHWTIQFAAERRLPPLPDLLAVYADPQMIWRIGAFLGGALLFSLNRKARPVVTLLSVFLVALPFVWTVAALFTESDPADRADQLLALWPFVLVVSFAFALWSLRRDARIERPGIALALPFILIATVNGAFLSQQVWGSTYALWPLFMILCACTFSVLFREETSTASQSVTVIARVPASLVTVALVSISLLLSGWYYVWSNERLSYVKLSEGEMVRSTLPELAGLSVRGPWIREFEGLVRFTQQHIPVEDGLLMIPGEDLFYYTTGRRPRFPALMFDHTVNPFSPEGIQRLARDRNIRWLVVKNKLQVNGEPVEDEARLLALLRQDFQFVQSLGVYDVYHRAGAL